MSEEDQRLNRGTEDNLCIQIRGLSFDGEDTYIEVPTDGEWHHIVFSSDAIGVSDHPFDGEVIMFDRALDADEVEEAYRREPPAGGADRVLSREEIEALFELVKNHPEIKSWEIKKNILYLEVEE
ncbi:MAG: hypothetical protein N2V72_00315 [Methanophagales archaeon]|nr:hypothetical protein [Methanophagales archaeon]